MSPLGLYESHLEAEAMNWFKELGWEVRFGPELEPEGAAMERSGFDHVRLEGRLQEALARLNPTLPQDALDEALRKLRHPESPSLTQNNRAFHHWLVDGVPVEFQAEGRTVGDQVRLVDFADPTANDWLVVNQFRVIEDRHNRVPDMVVFLNGLPVAVFELKNPADEKADVWKAFHQLQTYKHEIPSLFLTNELLVASDGLTARVGTLTANKERFAPWKTIDGEEQAPATLLQLEVLIRGMFEKQRLLDLLRFFLVYEDEGKGVLVKKLAGYHQFHAVNKALHETIRAAGKDGDRRVGVVWHTQGSGKSLTMAFYAGRLVVEPAMGNPTLVILSDRNDLDGQLFTNFSLDKDLLRQPPVQAENRSHLRELLQRQSGGVIFTTLQKFFIEEGEDQHPVLSARRNIVVMADEAHRSQYNFATKFREATGDLTLGFAQHMRDALPGASFIGFTGTPVELVDKNTRAVFGDYISVYDIQQAVADGATVPIYYESRLAQLELKESEKPKLDEEFEEVTEGEEDRTKERLKTKWAAIEALVGTEKRLGLIAKDLVDHFEKRQEALQGKAMVVCMSRRICVDLHKAIAKLRPSWVDKDDLKGRMKIVMTGSASDPLDWQPHIRNKVAREELAKRFRNPSTDFEIVIVRDMWLTGFDAPSLNTMYVDKPMQGHGLMQAIARVNRVFKDKPAGLVVDYLGLADQLKKALATYTQSGGKGDPTLDIAEAVAVMQEKHEICCGLFHGFNWSIWGPGTPSQRLGLLPGAMEHILALERGKERLLPAVSALSQGFALACTSDEAKAIREDVAFFQAIRSALVKGGGGDGTGKTDEEMEQAIRQLVSKAVAPGEVVDIFKVAGLDKPDLSILSDEFLAEVRGLEHKNLAVELLRRLLQDEIKATGKRNVVQGRSFTEMLEKSIRAYQNRAIETAQVIEELIQLAKTLREARDRGIQLGLNEDELAFYDALETNDSSVKVLGDDALRAIARDLVQAVRANVTIDWTVKESVRAKLRTMVKRVLRKHGYPPDKQEKATQTVLEQAEAIAAEWAA